MQTNELEMLSQRIREAEERLRRVEEENEDTSSGRPTPPVSPMYAVPTHAAASNELQPRHEDERRNRMHEEDTKEEVMHY
jgi:hypothetical protein